MELADTSAWTQRHLDVAVETAFEQAILAGDVATCGPVRYELLVTARNATEVAEQRKALDKLRQIAVGEREWRRAEDVLHALAERGSHLHRMVPLPDLLIAAAAERAELPVLHYDRHFELIASITGQPVRAIAPLGSL